MVNGSVGFILHAEVGLGNLVDTEVHAERPVLDGRAFRDVLAAERLAQPDLPSHATFRTASVGP